MINWGAREGLLSKSGKHLTQICDGCHTVQRQWTESYGAQWGCSSPDGQRWRVVALSQWCQYLRGFSVHCYFLVIWIGLKLKGLVILCFLH